MWIYVVEFKCADAVHWVWLKAFVDQTKAVKFAEECRKGAMLHSRNQPYRVTPTRVLGL